MLSLCVHLRVSKGLTEGLIVDLIQLGVLRQESLSSCAERLLDLKLRVQRISKRDETGPVAAAPVDPVNLVALIRTSLPFNDKEDDESASNHSRRILAKLLSLANQHTT